MHVSGEDESNSRLLMATNNNKSDNCACSEREQSKVEKTLECQWSRERNLDEGLATRS